MPNIKKHQTLMDFAAQHGGTLDTIFAIAVGNGISISALPAPGTLLLVPETDSANKKVVAAYIANGLTIATDLNLLSKPKGGINYMQIGNDFKVS